MAVISTVLVLKLHINMLLLIKDFLVDVLNLQ